MDQDKPDPDHMRRLMQIASAAGIKINNPAAKPGQMLLPPRAKPGRNSPCPCGSGKKFKKCCLNKGRRTPKVSRRPVERPMISGAHIDEVSQSTEAPADKQPTAQAMLRAGVDKRIVWAYLETGLFITEANRMAQPPERIVKWEAALEDYNNASEEDRAILIVEEVRWPGS